MVNNKTTNLINMQDYINMSTQNSLQLDNCSLFFKEKNYVLMTENIFRNKYRDLIMDNLIEVKLSDEEYNKFKYRPKRLSYEIYKTNDLWHLILWINNTYSITKFDFEIVKLFDPAKIYILNNIFEKEKNILIQNHKIKNS